MEKMLAVVVLTLCCMVGTHSQKYDLEKIRSIFVSNIMDTVGQGSNITLKDVRNYFEKNDIKLDNSTLSECVNDIGTNPTFDERCLLNKCLDPDDVYELSGLADGTSEQDVTTLTTILLHLMENSDCVVVDQEMTNATEHHITSAIQSWGYGILCTTIINLCSLTGVIVLPFIRGTMYKKVLIYMVGLAVGTLAGSSLLFLIPEALELTEMELDRESYVWKCLTVITAIYVFFNIERILKMLLDNRERATHHNVRRRTTSDRMDFSSFHLARPVSDYKNVDDLPRISPCGNKEELVETSSVSDREFTNSEPSIPAELQKEKADGKDDDAGSLVGRNNRRRRNGHGHHHAVEPVAWMIIFGDGIHNFIDGVSIGAAFTESTLAGISVSVAILCEELPHELGDFAVLLNAGMAIKKAVFYNFLSACMCYVGLVVGIFLGENTASHTWVFAFAGGMFLYISLVDMMPEMNGAAEVDENKDISANLIFFLQNIGLLTGFGLMLLMAVYGGPIEDAIRGTES